MKVLKSFPLQRQQVTSTLGQTLSHFDFYEGSIQRALLILTTSLRFPSSRFSGVTDTSTRPHPAGDVQRQQSLPENRVQAAGKASVEATLKW